METTIIIPTLNAGAGFRDLLCALQSQTVLCEIIVVDSSSSDNTPMIAESCGVRLITIPREAFDHGGTRLRAARVAKGDILVFMTQDTLPANEFSVEKLVKAFREEKIGAAFGRQFPYLETRPFGAHLRLFNYPEQSYVRSLSDRHRYGIKTPFLSNAFAAYRKSALEEIGGFGEMLIIGEDTNAGAKLLLAGYKISYAADAAVYHSHDYTVFEEFKRYFDIGVGHAREKWLLQEFGKAEGEGLRYLRSEIVFLFKNRQYLLFPECFVRNAMKFLGYRLGRHYEMLPFNFVKSISMHRDWWDMAKRKTRQI